MRNVRNGALVLAVALAWAATLQGQVGNTPSGRGAALLAQGLEARAQGQGRIRVIVGLAVPSLPDSVLPPAARASQRAQIAGAQTEVLSGFSGRDLGHVKRFRYAAGLSLEVDASTLRALSRHPRVAYVVEDGLLAPTLIESAAAIRAPEAWYAGYSGAGQTVAILDTGVDRAHPFFGGRVVAEACYSTTAPGYSALCSNGSLAPGAAAPCPTGCLHGTHVAGIAAGSGTVGGRQMRGIAPDSSIIAMQVFSRRNSDGQVLSFFSDVTLALEQVYSLRTTYNIAAVNLSLGTTQVFTSCDGLDPSLKAAMDALRGAGIATIVASGNSYAGTGVAFPGCVTSAISVGSTLDGGPGATPRDAVSDFSNSGSGLNLLAPGESITSSIPGGGYATYAGTSMAAPHVTGAWAVLKSRVPGATVEEILRALSTTGAPVTDPRNGVTTPRINVADAVTALAPCTYSINPSSVSIGAASTEGTLFVTTQPGCSWTAASGSSFIGFPSGTGFTGNAALPFSVASNPATAPRTGTATIAGQTFTVSQAGAVPCTYSVDLVTLSASADGASGTVTVTTPATCPWTAASSVPYLTFSDGVSRSGPGSASFTVAPSYSTVERSASATVAGHGFAVQQAGATPDADIVSSGRARADFNGDGFNDLLWQDMSSGYLAVWQLAGAHSSWTAVSLAQRIVDTDWKIVGTGDFNGDGKPDIVFHHRTSGALYLWYMDGPTRIGTTAFSFPGEPDTRWKVVGIGDFNGDRKPDLVWQHDNGLLTVYLMNGATLIGSADITPDRVLDPNWRIVGVGDLNGDRNSDLIFQHSQSGELAAWILNGTTRVQYLPFSPTAIVDRDWQLGAVVDVDGDQAPDLVWHHATNGGIAVWYMNGTMRRAAASFPAFTQPQWRLAGPK